MERRRAVAIATASVLTTVGAAAAVAANLGLLGSGADGPERMGGIDAGRAAEVVRPTTGSTAAPAAADPNVTVRYEDIYLPAPAAPAATPAPADGTTPTTVPADADAIWAEDPEGTTTDGYESGDDDEDHSRHDDHQDDDHEDNDHDDEDDD